MSQTNSVAGRNIHECELSAAVSFKILPFSDDICILALSLECCSFLFSVLKLHNQACVFFKIQTSQCLDDEC